MYKVTIDKFRKNYCGKWCIYKDLCCEAYKTACFNISQENLDYLASMIYNKSTHAITQGGDSN